MPRPIRSSDPSISSACCFVSAKGCPFFVSNGSSKTVEGSSSGKPSQDSFFNKLLQLHGLGFCGGPAEWFRFRDEAEFRGVLKIKFQPAAVFRIQRKVDVAAQVGFERSLGQFQILGRFIADFAEMREAEIARSQKIRGEFRGG